MSSVCGDGQKGVVLDCWQSRSRAKLVFQPHLLRLSCVQRASELLALTVALLELLLDHEHANLRILIRWRAFAVSFPNALLAGWATQRAGRHSLFSIDFLLQLVLQGALTILDVLLRLEILDLGLQI